MSEVVGHFFWNRDKIPYSDGESLAVALAKAGICDLGSGPEGTRRHLFCGIGQCQGCLVVINGERSGEACQTPARDGLRVMPEAENGR